MVNDKKKTYTIEEYQQLKKEVLNLRQAAVAEAESEKRKEIYRKLCILEEELSNARIVSNDTPKKINEFLDNDIISKKR